MKKLVSVILLLCTITVLFCACENEVSNTISNLLSITERDKEKKTNYQKTATVFVNDNRMPAGENSISASDLTAAEKRTETYAFIIRSNKVIEEVKEQFPDREFTVEVKIVEDTEVIQIIVSSDEEKDLARICNTVVDVACHVLEATVAGSSMKVIDFAKQ